MQQWNFYFSGILYGIIRYSKGNDSNPVHQQLNPFTGKMEPEVVLSDDSFYYKLCKRSLLNFFSQLSEYEDFSTEQSPFFTTKNGEIYSKCDNGSYIQRHVKFPKNLLVLDDQIYGVQMSGRDYTGVLVLDGMEKLTCLNRWHDIYSETERDVLPIHLSKTYMVPTRDGEQLATDVYLPVVIRDEKLPAILVRTPYGKSDGIEQYYRFIQRGYALVIQDVRGREDSSGEWLPNYYEVEDGDDTLNWIAAQPWCDGQIAMTGGSYLGYVQWAAAASGNPHLKAILSSVCAGSPFIDLPRRGGCFTSGSMAWNFAMSEKRFRADLMERDDWDQVLDIRPLGDMAKKSLGIDIPFLNKWMTHPDYDDFWRQSNWKERSCGHVVPALIMSGWFDDNGMGTTEALELVDSFYPQGTYKVILGPWKHSGNANYDLHGIYMGDPALRYDMDILCFQWIEHFLKGVDNGIEISAPVEYYTLGDNCWKEASHWPVPSTFLTSYYLDGDGFRLNLCKPKSRGCDSYDYDPENPALHIIDMSENELEIPEDYTREENRPDILCYSTPILETALTITGDITAVLYLSSDCPDTDLFVRITDVDECGKSIKLADGLIDVKYRNGFENPEFMKIDSVYEVRIRTTKISNTFLPGHCLRFTVTSSAKNFMFPNSNTTEGFDSKKSHVAHNTLHWGGEYASHILLPIELAQDSFYEI